MSRRHKKRTWRTTQQEMIAFDYHELLSAIVRDLKHIDDLIPCEVSRDPLVVESMSENARYVIVGRKDDLLRYIQTICRDHIEFGQKRLDKGWTPEQQERAMNNKSRSR